MSFRCSQLALTVVLSSFSFLIVSAQEEQEWRIAERLPALERKVGLGDKADVSDPRLLNRYFSMIVRRLGSGATEV